MCGIAGIVHAPRHTESAMESTLERMIGVLGHRGPDDSALWADECIGLGHTRLSIIDLSAAGRQPMHDDEGRFVIVYNGEIYNYRELRRELEARGHRFRTATDTEVVLHAYREWGAEALARFNGMWAFVIWDRAAREMFAARDRVGKKPFYFVRDADGTLTFASEVKALLVLGRRFQLNPQAAFDFVSQGTYGHLGRDSFFAGLDQLPAAHYMRLSPGAAPDVRRYWDLPRVASSDRVAYDEGARRRFRELLTSAVELRLRADVPVGTTLSGGIDSSAITLLIDRITGGAPMHIFTSQFPGSVIDESPYVQSVVSRLRQPVLHHATPDPEEWPTELLRVLDHQEEPFGDTSIVAHFRLMQAARQAGVPVVLSGQGADEMLFGYPSMVNAYLGALALRHPARFIGETRAWARSTGQPALAVLRDVLPHALPLTIRDRVRQRGLRSFAAAVAPELRERVSWRRFAVENGRSSLDSYLAQVFKRFALPHLTHYDDRNAMAHSVEGRMPFLDFRLVEFLSTLRYEALFSAGRTKRILRESFADVLPEDVARRTDKVGFFTPMAAWMRAHASWIQEFMSDERLRSLGVLDVARFHRRLGEFLRGDTGAQLEIWRGFVLHLWAERFSISTMAGDAVPGARERAPALIAEEAVRAPA